MKMTYESLQTYLTANNAILVAVSKTKPIETIQELYDKGQRIFGENRVQEMAEKYDALPKDIAWHMIGHLQKNKVKYMGHFVSMIHSVDNLKLAEVINKEAAKHDRVIDILLQIKIANEDTKSGWDYKDLRQTVADKKLGHYQNIRIRGLMGMATFTDNKQQVGAEFASLKRYYDELSSRSNLAHFDTLSMGMSGDYELAVEYGSNMVRIGSLLFGAR